jgi:hypothetical protein
MADSKRQQIMTALITRLQTITVANGYETDIGANVNEWHVTNFEEAELPAVDVRDTTESVEVRGGNHDYTLSIQIETKVSGTTAAAKMRDVIGDVIKAIGTDPSLGSLAQNVRPVQNEIAEIDQKDKRIASILQVFELRYITKAFKPFG